MRYFADTRNIHGAGWCNSKVFTLEYLKTGGQGPSEMIIFVVFPQSHRANTGIIFRMVYDRVYEIVYDLTSTHHYTNIKDGDNESA
jgi:hypothetical protein